VSRWLLYLALATASLAGIAMVTVDVPLARWVATYQTSWLWTGALDLLDHATGDQITRWSTTWIVVSLVAVAAGFARTYLRAALVLAGTHIAAPFITNQLKDLTDRLRPREWLRYIEHYGGDLPIWGHDDVGVSFPSGHVTHYASLLIPLVVVFPRSRPLRVLACVVITYVACARIGASAHWLSDTLGAITVTAVVAYALARGLLTNDTP